MIAEVFGEGGILSQKFAGYSPRKGQVDMATLIQEAIAAKEHAIAEGPTGTGKSLAYLVPAIERVTRPGAPKDARVIVVTANIALTEQLVQKDLPMLRSILGRDFSFALSKGKSNYLCQDSLGKALAEQATSGRKDFALDTILRWAQETEAGDVNELDETPPAPVWRKLSVQSDECKGKACKFYSSCFAEKAARAVFQSKIVVTNYHMFFAHLVVRAKMRELVEQGAPVEPDIVLPPAEVVIFDEAHKAAEIARDFLGFSVSKGGVDWLIRGFNHEIATATKGAADRFFSDLFVHKRSREYRARLRRGHPVREAGMVLAACLSRCAKFYKEAINAQAWSQDERAELELRARRGAALAEQVTDAMNLKDDGEVVYFVEETEKGGAILKSKPIDVAPFLAEELFGQYPSVVVTSATLATGTGSDAFGYVKKELGITKARELVAESPFSWKDQVLLVLPSSMREPPQGANAGPNSPAAAAYVDAVADHVRDVCKAAGGRTLGLFTSYKNMTAAADRCSSLPFRILKQKDAPPRVLVQRFKEDVSSCLLGCESFWAGVDVPGEALSCVVIDRIPFPTPDDPVIDAISAKNDRWFFDVAVPRAVIQMKQGFGRLIRTTTDRGCVVILDRRLVTKGYGRTFLKALPAVSVSEKLEAVTAFLASKG